MSIILSILFTLIAFWIIIFTHVTMNWSLTIKENPYGFALFMTYIFILLIFWIFGASLGKKIDKKLDKE